MSRSKTIVFLMTGFQLADIWLKARIAGIQLNEAIVCEFADLIRKRTNAKRIIPKISGLSQHIAETIVGANLDEYFVSNPARYMRIDVRPPSHSKQYLLKKN